MHLSDGRRSWSFEHTKHGPVAKFLTVLSNSLWHVSRQSGDREYVLKHMTSMRKAGGSERRRPS